MEVRPTPSLGGGERGLFATQHIRRQRHFLCYHGAYFTSRPPFSKFTMQTYLHNGEVSREMQQFHIVADDNCLARFINHESEKPTCKFFCDTATSALYIDVVRSVHKDQQLSIDYGADYCWREDPVPSQLW